MTLPRCDKLMRVAETLDANPKLWPVYADDFKAAITATRETLIEHRRAVESLRGAGRLNRFGEFITVRGRAGVLKERLWRERPHTCEQCGQPVEWATMHPHHVVMVARGGSDDDSNVRQLCSLCHDRQHA